MKFAIRKKLMAGFLGVIFLLGIISSISYKRILALEAGAKPESIAPYAPCLLPY